MNEMFWLYQYAFISLIIIIKLIIVFFKLQSLYTQLKYTIHGVYVIIYAPKRNDYLSQLTLAREYVIVAARSIIYIITKLNYVASKTLHFHTHRLAQLYNPNRVYGMHTLNSINSQMMNGCNEFIRFSFYVFFFCM